MKRLIFLLLLLIFIPDISAQKSKLKDLEMKRKQALIEIESTDKLLKDIKGTASTLLSRIKLISNQIATRESIVSLLEQEVNAIEVEEKKIKDEISTLNRELELKKQAYHKAIISMMRNRDGDNKLLFILSGQSLSESYRRFKYLKDYSEWRKREAEEIIKKGQLLELKQDSLQLTRKEKEGLLSERSNEQKKLKTEETNYQQEVSKIRANQKELQQVLDQKKRQAKALDKQIEKLIAEEIARQEAKAKKEAEAAAKKAAEEQRLKELAAKEKGQAVTPTPPSTVKSQAAPVQAVSTQENIKLSGNFAANRGQLPFPITGRYSITSRFGVHKQGKWITTSSGGLDIQSQANAKAKAVFNGEVTHVSSFPGYGTCVIIRHGNYYTFYGNIKNIEIKKGDKVTTGQTLGTIYTDPDTNISEMHFQLWQSKTKLDPEPWLRK